MCCLWNRLTTALSFYIYVGPKLFWIVQIVVVGSKSFWLVPNHFGRVQIILVRFKLDFYWLIFTIWTCPKWFEPDQNKLGPSKTIGTRPKWFGWYKIIFSHRRTRHTYVFASIVRWQFQTRIKIKFQLGTYLHNTLLICVTRHKNNIDASSSKSFWSKTFHSGFFLVKSKPFRTGPNYKT